jgi:hypothetical protein
MGRLEKEGKPEDLPNVIFKYKTSG